MKQSLGLLAIVFLLLSCDEPKKGPRLLADSSGRINTVTVVMPKKYWNGALGTIVKKALEKEYEGLPLVEPQFTLNYLPPKLFDGFTKHSRNVILFVKDTANQINLYQDLYAKPQFVVQIRGEDADSQVFLFSENEDLIARTIIENERKEKRRRMLKSPAKSTPFIEKFGFRLTYPTAYKTFKTDTNFVWIQKEIPKGHLNLIGYKLSQGMSSEMMSRKTIQIRDSVGKKHIPGRLSKSYMATEKAYRPYFYKTRLKNRENIITKGMWSVANDYMAGPFVQYALKEKNSNNWLVLEGFAFAPSVNKREYMFELETIIRSINWPKKN